MKLIVAIIALATAIPNLSWCDPLSGFNLKIPHSSLKIPPPLKGLNGPLTKSSEAVSETEIANLQPAEVAKRFVEIEENRRLLKGKLIECIAALNNFPKTGSIGNANLQLQAKKDECAGIKRKYDLHTNALLKNSLYISEQWKEKPADPATQELINYLKKFRNPKDALAQFSRLQLGGATFTVEFPNLTGIFPEGFELSGNSFKEVLKQMELHSKSNIGQRSARESFTFRMEVPMRDFWFYKQ